MFAALLLSVAAAPQPLPSAPLPGIVQEDGEVAAAIEKAGRDVAKLLELAEGYSDAKKRSAAKQVYRRVVELDPDNEVARKALRHQRYDGKWFESYVELAKYKREEEARMKDKGMARFGDQWVPAAELPYMQMGWTKVADGIWKHPAEIAEDEQVAAWKAAGHQFRADDSSWVAPDDFEKWTAVQWKCGDEWLDTDAANAYHADFDHPWILEGQSFVVVTTCDWNTGNVARWHADKVHADLVRLFGAQPKAKPHFFLLNSLDQYNQAAGSANWLPDNEGFSSLHGAYFSESFFDQNATPPRYRGGGVAYWATADPQIAAWGPFWLRWAAAQSFVDAIDRSWNAVGAFVASGGQDQNAAQAFGTAFWEEKAIPRWLRYGAASYVERFGKNPEAAEGADPWDLRGWAFGEVAKAGGLRPLDQVFAFALDLNELESSSKLYHEAGLVVSYLLDGASGDAKVGAAHQALKDALAAGDRDATKVAAKALEKVLARSEKKVRDWGGIE